MPKQSKNKLVIGGVAGLAIVAVAWFFMRSGSAAQPSTPMPQQTITMTEDEPAERADRSEPRGSTGRARLGAAAAASVEDETQDAVTQKSKTKRSKKRSRKKKEREREEEESKAAKKGKKEKFYGK